MTQTARVKLTSTSLPKLDGVCGEIMGIGKKTGVVSLSDGSQNLDVIVIDPLNRTMILDAYALKD